MVALKKVLLAHIHIDANVVYGENSIANTATHQPSKAQKSDVDFLQ